jgi:hypothetical protein
MRSARLLSGAMLATLAAPEKQKQQPSADGSGLGGEPSSLDTRTPAVSKLTGHRRHNLIQGHRKCDTAAD